MSNKKEDKFIQNLIKDLLVAIGEDVDREGLVDTPKRVAKMYKSVYSFYTQKAPPKITVFKNNNDEIYYNGMIIDEGYFFSTCEHHTLPFFGDYYFGYIPNKYIMGASKIARVVDYFSSALQIQERLGQQVVSLIDQKVKPHGCILVLRARHLCREMRGAKKIKGNFETINLTGVFKENIDDCKAEFMSRISGATRN